MRDLTTTRRARRYRKTMFWLGCSADIIGWVAEIAALIAVASLGVWLIIALANGR